MWPAIPLMVHLGSLNQTRCRALSCSSFTSFSARNIATAGLEGAF